MILNALNKSKSITKRKLVGFRLGISSKAYFNEQCNLSKTIQWSKYFFWKQGQVAKFLILKELIELIFVFFDQDWIKGKQKPKKQVAKLKENKEDKKES